MEGNNNNNNKTTKTTKPISSKWKPTPNDLTELEKRKIIAKVIELSILVINRNHVYTFENKTYSQRKGGATGLRMTGILARIHMDKWSRKFKVSLKENIVKTYSNTKYVDDVNMATESIGLGTRWITKEENKNEEGTLKWQEEWETEDTKNEISDDRVTLNGILAIANSLSSTLQFTGEIPEDQIDEKLPMLDFCTFYAEENGKKVIKHEYYEKGCTSKMVTMCGSAQSHKQKINTLAQETIRRMRNTGRDIPKERRAEIICNMKQKLLRSGYSESMCMNAIESGMEGYYRMAENEVRGIRQINRPQQQDRLEREMDKVTAKEDWHNKRDNNKTSTTSGVGAQSTRAPGRKVGNPQNKKNSLNREQDHTKTIESIVFIPHTPHSKLLKSLQEAETQFCNLQNCPKWKFVESGVQNSKTYLQTTHLGT